MSSSGEVFHYHFLNQYLGLPLILVMDLVPQFFWQNEPKKARNSSARLVSSSSPAGSPKQCGLAFQTSSPHTIGGVHMNNVQSTAGPLERTRSCATWGTMNLLAAPPGIFGADTNVRPHVTVNYNCSALAQLPIPATQWR